MAITKSDCLILLTELENNNISNADTYIKELMKYKEPTLNIIKFINDNKELECRNFYEKIRKSYNEHHSKLYKNIVTNDLEPKEILTCLASLNLQILIHLKNVKNSQMFLRQLRFEEIQKVMLNYAIKGDIIPCQKLLELFRADIKVLESLSTDKEVNN